MPFCIKHSVFCFTLVCCVLCELCGSVWALECCVQVLVSGGGECRVPSLATAAVESGVLFFYFFSFIFDVSAMGNSWGFSKTSPGPKRSFCDLVTACQPSPSGTAEPIRTSYRPASNFGTVGRKHEKLRNREKYIAAAAPRSLREATATRLLRWRTR